MTEEKKYYVSNKKLFQVFLEHIKEVNEAKESGKPIPKMHPFIADSVIKIANKYANRPNFIRYSYRDEMIADAIEMCCRNYLKFNPEKSENPFAYLTQFCHNAFLQRINKEKKQQSVKAKIIANSIDEDFITTQSHDDDEFRNSMLEFLRENEVYVDTIQERKEREKKAKVEEVSPLDALFKEDYDEDSSNR